MSSDRESWSFRVREVLRAVLRAPSSRRAVARISAAEHDFPCRILATHWDACAIVVIFAIRITSRKQFTLDKARVNGCVCHSCAYSIQTNVATDWVSIVVTFDVDVKIRGSEDCQVWELSWW